MKKIGLILLLISTGVLAENSYINIGTSDTVDYTNTPGVNVFIKSTPSAGYGVAKGALIKVEQTDGEARNVDALRAEIVTKGTILDSSNGIHGVARAINGTPKSGAAFTGVWGESYAPKTPTDNIGYIAVGAEVNVYQTKITNSSTPYLPDPLTTRHSNHGATIGVLINNYQGTAENGHLAYDPNNIGIGNYWNDFGLAITSQSKTGRAFGYQTGIYVSEVAKEMIHLRGGVLGNNQNQTEYGIIFDGTPMSKAAIALGNNKINFGGYSGTLQKEGDLFYNTTNGQLWFKDNISNKVLVKTDSIGNENQLLTISNGNPKWSNDLVVDSINVRKKQDIKPSNNINSNAGVIHLGKTNYIQNKYSCSTIYNSMVTKNDVIILNLQNNNQEGIFTTQVDSIGDGKFRVCVKSDINTEDSLSINFAKIGIH